MKTTTLRPPSDDVWRCCWSTRPDPGTDLTRLRDGSFLRCRPRVKPGGTKQLYEVGPAAPFEKRTVAVNSDASETSPCRRTGQAKRRARHPSVDGVGRRRTAGIETRVWSGRPPSCRVGSVRVHSVVGPHRSGLSRVLTVRSPVRGPIQSWWGRACAAARRARSSLRSRSRSVAVAGVAPVRPVAPRTGPEFHVVGAQVPFMSSPSRRFWFCARDTALSLTRSGTAWRRRAPASSTGSRPPGRSWPPAPTAPCACHASSPDAASTPWPWANSAA